MIEPLPPPVRQGGARRDDRQVLNGVFYGLRTGIPWDDLPERYGPSGTVYNRYNRYNRGWKQGIGRAMYEAPSERLPWSVEMIASISVKAHRGSAGTEKGV